MRKADWNENNIDKFQLFKFLSSKYLTFNGSSCLQNREANTQFWFTAGTSSISVA